MFNQASGQTPPGGATPPSGLPPSSPQQRTSPLIPQATDDTVTLNFVNADIQAVIRAVSEITGQNILLDPRVTGTVNIIAPRPVPRSMVFSILQSALRAQGFAAVVGDNNLVQIVPEAEAKFHAGEERRGARGDQIITQVFRLDYEQAQQVVTALRPLVSPNNVINAFPATNTVVVTDYAENINRIRRLIANVDQPNPGELFSIPLQHASAIDVLQAISNVMPEVRAAGIPQGAQGGAPQPTPPTPGLPGATTPSERVLISVEPRSNSLLVRAFNPSLATRIRHLVESLDTPTNSLGNLHVIYLRNAEAAKIAEALRGLLTGQSGGAQRAGATPFGGGAQPSQSAFGGGGLTQTSAGGIGGQAGGGMTTGPTITFQQGAAGGQASLAFSAGGATVQAYPEMNSLVLIAPDYLYNQLRAAIDQLDERRAQIYIEALVVEVSATKGNEFGIQWQHIPNAGTGAGVIGLQGFTNGTAGSNIAALAANPVTVAPTLPGLALGVVNGTVTVNGTTILNLGVLARALATDGGANILSTPALLTLDNEEARIVVGQNIPIVTGSYTLASSGGAAGGATNPFQTFDRRDVGIQLRVKPQVAQGGSVKMELYEEVSSVVQGTLTNAQGPVTNKRSLESTVLVDDGQIIVIGGLIQDDMENSQQAVPILGSIPVIGNLFRYENRTRSKTNLMIFLRPVILHDTEAAAKVTGDRYDYIRGIQQMQRVPARFALPEYSAPDFPSQFNRTPGTVKPPVTPIPQGSGPTPTLDLRSSSANIPATPVAPAPAAGAGQTQSPAVTAQPAPPMPAPEPAPVAPQNAPTTSMPPPTGVR